MVVIVIDGTHHELRTGHLFLQFLDALDPALARQVNVHKRNIRFEHGELRQCLLGIRIDVRAGKALRAVDKHTQGFSDFFQIFYYGNVYGFHAWLIST